MGIDPAFAEIHWRDDRQQARDRVSDVDVFDRRLPRKDRPELGSSAGACASDWLTGEDPRSSPEGLYVQWVRDGFVDDEAHLEALRELSKIEGLVWARTMADALERRLRAEGALDQAD